MLSPQTGPWWCTSHHRCLSKPALLPRHHLKEISSEVERPWCSPGTRLFCGPCLYRACLWGVALSHHSVRRRKFLDRFCFASDQHSFTSEWYWEMKIPANRPSSIHHYLPRHFWSPFSRHASPLGCDSFFLQDYCYFAHDYFQETCWSVLLRPIQTRQSDEVDFFL